MAGTSHRVLKTALRGVLPRPVLGWARRLRQNWSTREARRAFYRASPAPAYLPPETLEALAARYPAFPDYGYDPATLESRGSERANKILAMLRTAGGGRAEQFLELACHDGMVCAALRRQGKEATGIDLGPPHFDARAMKEGVTFSVMDAARLEFPDGSFDCVFSFNAFEHFSDPAAVLTQAVRVLRPGGFVLLGFGPLYQAPYGLHAYRSIPIPYCQFLFTRQDLQSYCEDKGLESIDFDDVNGWRVGQYRDLWASQERVLRPVVYNEGHDLSGLALIEQYPSCFRSKTDDFESLIVTDIEALFQKTDAAGRA